MSLMSLRGSSLTEWGNPKLTF